MITSRQSMELLVNALQDGDWKYTQGGARGGREDARDVSAQAGDCTDFTFAMTRKTLGAPWNTSWAAKANTTALWNGTAAGYTQIESENARPGDIVVNGPGRHAGVYIGRDADGNAIGWANNGSPATPTSRGRDGETGSFNFGSSPRFVRPITP
jgi:hypothetical protein